jgi:hypothetical protein
VGEITCVGEREDVRQTTREREREPARETTCVGERGTVRERETGWEREEP